MKKGRQISVWGWHRMLSIPAAPSPGPRAPGRKAGEVRMEAGVPLGEGPPQGTGVALWQLLSESSILPLGVSCLTHLLGLCNEPIRWKGVVMMPLFR